MRSHRGTTSLVEVQRSSQIATIRLNVPERLNALTVEGWERLGEAAHSLSEAADVRAVVVRGTGERAFCAGIDLQELATRSISDVSRALTVVEETLLRIEHLPMPTIAVVHGWALGAGCELTMACDLRIATPEAAFGLPIARLGLMAHNRLVKRAVDYLGPALTRELLYTGRTITGAEAAELHFVNRLASPQAMDARLGEMLDEMAQASFGALRAAKRAVALGLPLSVAFGAEITDAAYFVDPTDFPHAAAGVRSRKVDRK